jgi:hypothetical protein
MTNNRLPSKFFFEKPKESDENTLIIGYNSELLASFSKGSMVIDPSLSKTHLGHSQFPENIFLTKDLATFTLDKKFTSIISVNTLHLSKNLPLILKQIEKHLVKQASLYFQLSPNPVILNFLNKEPWSCYRKDPLFQIRNRSDVEEAALFAPFLSVLIEEKIEYLYFYSKEVCSTYLYEQLNILTDLVDDKLLIAVKELVEIFYLDHDEDQVLTIAAPWIFLYLSNEKDLL